MGLYIKGMEMPKNEPLLVKINPDGFVNTTTRNDYRKYEAIPIPPHRLIDREQILDDIRLKLAQANAVNDVDEYDEWMHVFDYVRKFPTFIPAEPEEEETK